MLFSNYSMRSFTRLLGRDCRVGIGLCCWRDSRRSGRYMVIPSVVVYLFFLCCILNLQSYYFARTPNQRDER